MMTSEYDYIENSGDELASPLLPYLESVCATRTPRSEVSTLPGGSGTTPLTPTTPLGRGKCLKRLLPLDDSDSDTDSVRTPSSIASTLPGGAVGNLVTQSPMCKKSIFEVIDSDTEMDLFPLAGAADIVDSTAIGQETLIPNLTINTTEENASSLQLIDDDTAAETNTLLNGSSVYLLYGNKKVFKAKYEATEAGTQVHGELISIGEGRFFIESIMSKAHENFEGFDMDIHAIGSAVIWSISEVEPIKRKLIQKQGTECTSPQLKSTPKKKKDPESWKKNIRKRKTNSGQSYVYTVKSKKTKEEVKKCTIGRRMKSACSCKKNVVRSSQKTCGRKYLKPIGSYLINMPSKTTLFHILKGRLSPEEEVKARSETYHSNIISQRWIPQSQYAK